MKKITFLAIIVLAAIACGKDDKQKALEVLQSAEATFQQNQFAETKVLLDSLHRTYPRLVDVRREADTLLWKVLVSEINRDMPEIDSTLKTLHSQAEEIAKNYKFVKDAKYQTLGDYEHKNMQNTINTERTYLKPITDEEGNFRIISTLVGKSLSHNQLMVSAGAQSVATSQIRPEAINSYNDFGVNYELSNFSDSTVAAVASFIGDNLKTPMTVTLKGNAEFSYKLSEKSATIIAETYRFSEILKKASHYQKLKTEKLKTLEVMQLRLTTK